MARPHEGYDAFISYSQEADRSLAAALYRGLRRLNRKPLRAYALRVFRDHNNLAANPDLWAVVESALERSRYFVLLASPAAANSRWVRREIGYWQRNRDASTFVIVHTDGEIHWDQEAEDFDWERTTALPRQLKGWFPAQPGWVPLVWTRQEPNLSLRDQRFRTAVCKLAAPIHGVSQDELDNEDRRRLRRNFRIYQTIAAVMVVLTVVAVTQALRADREADLARHNEALAVDRLANLLAAESNTSTVSRHDPLRALLFALTAADMRPAEATWTALYDALESQPHLMRILNGHSANKVIVSNPPTSAGIHDLVYSPRTGELISAGDDGRIIRWDPATGRRRVLSASQYLYRGGVFDLAISPDGTRLASTGTGNTAVWDLTTGTPSFGPNQRLGGSRVTFDANGRLHLMACSVCATNGVELRSWDPAGGQQISSIHYPRYTAAIASGGPIMAGAGCLQNGVIAGDGCTQGFIQLWDTATGQAAGEPLVAPGKEIMSADVSPDGTRIVAGTRDGRLQLWDVASRRLLESWQGHTGLVRTVRFSPDGKRFATGGQDGRASVWNASDVRAKPQTFSAYASPVTAVAFSPYGQQLATSNELHTIMVWSLDPGTHTGFTFNDPQPEPRSVAVSPDGRTVVLGGGDGILTVYDRATRQAVRRLPVAPVCPHRLEDFKGSYHPCYINVVRFSPDGRMLQVASSSGNISRWDTTTWMSLGERLVADVPCRSMVCDGRTLTARSLAFSPDLNLVAVGGRQRIWVWDLEHNKLLHTIAAHDSDVTSLAFSPDGQFLASGGKDKTVMLWDPRDGHQVGKPMRHDGEVTAVAFQPRHNQLASNGTDNVVRVWDIGTQDQVVSFRNDSANYEPGLVFSADGAYLATTTTNYYIMLRETRTWTAFPRFREPTSIMAVTFDPGSPALVSVAKGSGKNAPAYVTTRNYDVAEWQRRACAIVPGNLDFQTIETYTTGKTQVCAAVPVDGSVVRNWLETAQSRLNQKDTTGAADAYREAARLARADDNDDAELAHVVCLTGTVSRYQKEVLSACDWAVDRVPDSGPFHTARAVARALDGDRTGAIEDLRAYITWAEASGLFLPNTVRWDAGVLDARAVAKRQAWITELAAGRDPFTPATLTALWSEYLQDQGGNTFQTCPVNVGAWVEWVLRPTGC